MQPSRHSRPEWGRCAHSCRSAARSSNEPRVDEVTLRGGGRGCQGNKREVRLEQLGRLEGRRLHTKAPMRRSGEEPAARTAPVGAHRPDACVRLRPQSKHAEPTRSPAANCGRTRSAPTTHWPRHETSSPSRTNDSPCRGTWQCARSRCAVGRRPSRRRLREHARLKRRVGAPLPRQVKPAVSWSIAWLAFEPRSIRMTRRPASTSAWWSPAACAAINEPKS